MEALLEVKGLRTNFYRGDGVVKAVDGVDFSVGERESLGIVGESGSGKSVSVMSILKLLRKNGRVEGGSAIFQGRDLLTLEKEEMRQVRGKDISLIFQDPMSSLNPTFRVGRQIMEPMLWHKLCTKDEARARAIDLLGKVGIPSPETRVNDYPHQFSGGMRQRVMIAMALACKPKLLIADEPTTALDVTVRSQILNLMQDMKEESGSSVIMITHDFTVASNFCDKIVVMYAGRVMETARTTELLRAPAHPYSKGLLGSVLDIDSDDMKLQPIPGSPPDLVSPPDGCRFHQRCPFAEKRCAIEEPVMREVGPDHYAACHLAVAAEGKNA